MRETRSPGSVRGVRGDAHPYRDNQSGPYITKMTLTSFSADVEPRLRLRQLLEEAALKAWCADNAIELTSDRRRSVASAGP